MHGAFKACIQCMDFELWAMITLFSMSYIIASFYTFIMNPSKSITFKCIYKPEAQFVFNLKFKVWYILQTIE